MFEISSSYADRVLLVSALLLLSASASQAQTQASCTFTFLPTMVTIPNFGTATWSASGTTISAP